MHPLAMLAWTGGLLWANLSINILILLMSVTLPDLPPYLVALLTG